MATQTAPYYPPRKSQDAIREFYRQCYRLLDTQWNLRTRFYNIDLQYMRELDRTAEQVKARHANKVGDPTKFQNIVMPVVLPQVENATTYQQSVFLSGYPIFSSVAPSGLEDAALQFDTIIGEQQIRGNWVAALNRALRNGFKYNLGAVEVDWTQQVSYSLESDVTYKAGAEGKPKEIIWAGNTIKDLDMYNLFFDTRVSPTEVSSEGEFAGYTKLMSRIRLKKFISELPGSINVKEAFESGFSGIPSSDGTASYFVPSLNPSAINDITNSVNTDWDAWVSLSGADRSAKIRYHNMYEVTTLYGRILPSDFNLTGIPGQGTPQVWKFIIVNNNVLIYAERLTNAHNLIPILFAVPNDDGLAYQTKSLAENVEPMQSITTALANSSIAARRRAISDRMLYDSSRISAAAINSDSPIAKIPVRPSAFGGSLAEAVHPIPFEDGQFQFNQAEIAQFLSFANQISGLNPARQGQFVKGNKTKFEYADVMQYANGRDQNTALALEGSFFGPLKEIIKSNILQYQGGTSLVNRDTGNQIDIQPDLLRKANLTFKLADGLLPSDKLMSGEELSVALQTLSAAPQLAQGYNIVPAFSYLMKARGADLRPYEKSQEQLAYEQAIQAWQGQVNAMLEYFSKLPEPPAPQDIQKLLPPQPQPQQFNYDPKKKSYPASNTIMQQVSQYAGNQGGQG